MCFRKARGGSVICRYDGAIKKWQQRRKTVRDTRRGAFSPENPPRFLAHRGGVHSYCLCAHKLRALHATTIFVPNAACTNRKDTGSCSTAKNSGDEAARSAKKTGPRIADAGWACMQAIRRFYPLQRASSGTRKGLVTTHRKGGAINSVHRYENR